MSLTGKRQEFADALSTVNGVSGFPLRPQSNNVGDAWAIFGGMDRDERVNQFTVTWRVFVILPADQATADTWIDDHVEDLYVALQPIAFIDSITPVLLSDGGQRALQFETRSE